MMTRYVLWNQRAFLWLKDHIVYTKAQRRDFEIRRMEKELGM